MALTRENQPSLKSVLFIKELIQKGKIDWDQQSEKRAFFYTRARIKRRDLKREKIMNHSLNKLFLYLCDKRKRNLKQNFIIGALGLLFIVVKEDSATLSIWIRSQFFHGIIEPYLLPSSTFKIILFSGTIKALLHPFLP